MRTVRGRRRSFLDLRRITIGDWIVLAASGLTVISLFLPWFGTSTPRPHDEWAFTYSEVASAVAIVFFLATVFLVIYPALSPDLGLPPLPFSAPPMFFIMGAILLLIFTYELGKYACIECPVNREYGVWVGLIAAAVYLLGGIIRWGSRPPRRTA